MCVGKVPLTLGGGTFSYILVYNSDMKQYLNILVDAVNKKENILDQIRLLVDRQEECISSEKFSLEEYNRIMEEKGALIASLDKLDDGFTAVYARVSPKLREDPLPYVDQIKTLQNLIAGVSEKTALIQAKEMRISKMIERMVKAEHVDGVSVTSKSDAARKYASVMNRTNVMPGSIFINKKK